MEIRTPIAEVSRQLIALIQNNAEMAIKVKAMLKQAMMSPNWDSENEKASASAPTKTGSTLNINAPQAEINPAEI